MDIYYYVGYHPDDYQVVRRWKDSELSNTEWLERSSGYISVRSIQRKNDSQTLYLEISSQHNSNENREAMRFLVSSAEHCK